MFQCLEQEENASTPIEEYFILTFKTKFVISSLEPTEVQNTFSIFFYDLFSPFKVDSASWRISRFDRTSIARMRFFSLNMSDAFSETTSRRMNYLFILKSPNKK